MALPTPVNGQITDAVTQANVKVIGDAPAFAMGSIYQQMAHSTGILFENAVSAQQQQNSLAQAAANQGVMQIYSLDTTAAAGASGAAAQLAPQGFMSGLLGGIGAFPGSPPLGSQIGSMTGLISSFLPFSTTPPVPLKDEHDHRPPDAG